MCVCVCVERERERERESETDRKRERKRKQQPVMTILRMNLDKPIFFGARNVCNDSSWHFFQITSGTQSITTKLQGAL